MSEDEIIQQRIPVWEALAELFFNSNISDADQMTDYIITTCNKSGYSIPMLEKIYIYEVLPTLFTYVSGYDDSSTGISSKLLRQMILSYTQGKLVTKNTKPTILNALKSKYYSFLIRKNWRYLKNLLERSRQCSNSSSNYTA